MTTLDGSTVYDHEGEPLGSIHYSPRSRRWYTVVNRVAGPSRYFDAQDAADSLRGGL